MRYSESDGKWCKVEIMGHVEHIARAAEVQFLDGKVLRVCDETEPLPIFYTLAAVFSLRWLTEDEGQRLSDRRVAEVEERHARHLRGAFLGAIQETIRMRVFGAKVTPLVLKAMVFEDHPAMTSLDFEEAIDGMGIDEIEVDGVKMLWIDPDGMPF